MKYKLILLCLATLFALSSCKNEDITCTMEIITPSIDEEAEYPVFWEYQPIQISVTASTTKGTISQVEIFVDDDVIESTLVKPYNFTIPSNRIEAGLHSLTAVVFTSSGDQAVDAQYITIKKLQ